MHVHFIYLKIVSTDSIFISDKDENKEVKKANSFNAMRNFTIF